MTQDQIKAIAEEYAKDNINSVKAQIENEDDYIREFNMEFFDVLRDGCICEAIKFLNWLSTRYCIAERDKVIALYYEIFCAIMEAHEEDDMQMVAHEVLDVMPRRFAAVFGI